MLVSIRNWKRIEKGLYGSDQQTFSYKLCKHLPLYMIRYNLGGGGFWEVGRFNSEKGQYDTIFMDPKTTLKACKEIAEKDFGQKQMLTDEDMAMQKGGK